MVLDEVRQEGYASVSEYFRELIREHRKRRRILRADQRSELRARGWLDVDISDSRFV